MPYRAIRNAFVVKAPTAKTCKAAVTPITARSAVLAHDTIMARSNPFSSGPTWGQWLLPTAGGALIVCGALFLLSSAARHDDLTPAFQKSDAPVARPQQIEYPEMVDAASSRTVVVYSCERGSQRVFSDTPCGPGGSVREIDVGQLNTYSPAPVEQRPTTAARAGSRSAPPKTMPAVSGEDPVRQICAAIEEAIEGVDARMRAGYTSAEGEILRRRWRDLKEEHHRAGCTWREP